MNPNDEDDLIPNNYQERKLLLNQIRGGLVSCINTHGPITKEYLSSAEKRIYSHIKAYRKEIARRKNGKQARTVNSARERLNDDF